VTGSNATLWTRGAWTWDIPGRRLYADARFAAGAAAIGLAGTEVERVAARVVGIGGQRADRVLRDPAREVCPARVRCESVVRPPNATAGGANPETAVTRHARRRDDENWATACGCIGLTGEREHAGLDSVLQGPVRLPVVIVSCVALGGEPGKSVLGFPQQPRRDLIGRVGSRGGFVRLVPACRAFARYSAGASEYHVQITGHLTFGLPVLRQLAGRITDANEPAAASEKSHCRRR